MLFEDEHWSCIKSQLFPSLTINNLSSPLSASPPNLPPSYTIQLLVFFSSVGRDACSHHPWLSEWILSLLSMLTRPPWIRKQRAYFRKETYFPSSPGRKTIIDNLPLLTGKLPEWGDLRLVWEAWKGTDGGIIGEEERYLAGLTPAGRPLVSWTHENPKEGKEKAMFNCSQCMIFTMSAI